MSKQILLAFAALAFGSSNAIAASHFHIVASLSANSEASSTPAVVAANLHGIIADFGVLPPASSTDWPCYGGSPDCTSIASGGMVIGAPNFTWSLASCNSRTKKETAPCAQLFWMYEDDTNDTSDDLTFSVFVTQGKNYILAASEDYGTNPFGAGVISVAGDFAFGTQGNHTGPGNGWCFVDTVTCVGPKPGLANVVVTTSVGSYSVTQKFQINLQ